MLTNSLGVSFEILPKKKVKVLDPIEKSRQEARDGEVYHYNDIEDFFKKNAYLMYHVITTKSFSKENGKGVGNAI